MNYIIRLLLAASLILPVSVWAQGVAPKQYLNLYYKSKQLYIGLYNKNCVVGNSSEDEGTCVKSYEIKPVQTVRSAFVNAISGQWVLSPDAAKKQSATLNLATDIDFGYTFENGSCSENFDFLPFSGLTFNGQNHMMSNFCRIDNGQTKRYLGLFGEVVGDQTNGHKTIRDLIISNVHFAVTSGEPALTSGGDYQPAGALAARISNSTVTNVKLKDVVIQAPLAGGLAGFIEGSTITEVSTIDNSFIKVSNGISITEDYIGKAIYKNGDNVSVFNPYKVLLGGLAGAAYFSNFQDINIAVQVENNGDVDLSALGGLVGHYVYAPKNNQFPQVSDRNSKISNVKIHGNSSTDAASVKSLISGGTAMGGIFGATRRLDNNNSPITELTISESAVTNLDIKQSRVKISGVDVTQKLYLGGVVGNADLCNGGILKIIESNVVNANIEESILENGNFQYYMGGIAGFASCDHVNNSGNRNDLYLTLQKSNVSGNIKLDGGYSKTGKTSLSVRTSAAMGGLVGDAIVSLDEGGISENESKVSISYKAKRSASDDLDSVLVGGVFGGLSLFNSPIDYVHLTKLYYEGSIDIEDDGITARVGGIVGKYPFISRDDAKIEIYDVHAKTLSAGSIVSYSGETKASNTSSSIGGICGMCQSPKLISHSSVDGSFMGTFGTENPPQKEFYVGGLVGYSLVKDLMVVKNNYFTKTIADKFNKVEGKGHAGYLFGYLTGDGLGTKPQITSNFHYGADNLGAIGYFKNYGEFANSVYLNDMDKFDAKNNVRNGATEDVNENGNGYVAESYMASKDFAVYLNGPWTEAEDQVWTFANNGFLPTFGTEPLLTYTVRFLDGSDNVLAAGEISYGGSAESLAPEAPKIAGKCFTGWNEPIDKVFKSMDLYPQYEVGACKYTVTFNGLDGTPLKKTVAEDGTELKNPQTVEEGKSAILPKGPDRVGNNCFLKWDDEDVNNDFSNVTHNIVVSAISKACYDVTFYGLDEKPIANAKTKNGQDLDNPQVVDGGSAAIAPADPPSKDDLCFIGWDTDFSVVKGDLEVKANTRKCVFKVNFYGLDGTTVIKTQNVQEGLPARAPTTPEQLGDLCFDGWDTDFSVVKGDLEVKANTKACPNSSSSDQQQSSSSSSSEISSESSSSSSVENGDNYSSSSAGNGDGSSSSAGNDKYSSSSSAKDESSSSKGGSSNYNYIYELAEPTARLDGSALRMTLGDTLADKLENVDYHIVVKSDAGIYLDTVVDAKSVESVKNGLWRLDPAPVGEYTVTFTLTDGDDSISYDKKFITEKQKTYTPRAWQTLSLNAFCYNKGDGCLSDLETRFGLTQSDWAKEECKYMQDEVKRGMNDAQFYQRMKNVCAQASGSGAVTSVYWWDESNPVGEFWQYRKFSVKDKFDSTRGYWYGPVNHEPFAMSLQTPKMNDAIEWHLENKYSGWNLVANPYGWYVKLPKDENINFCQWDPDSSGYVEPDVLGPYEALWVHTEKSMTYRIPLKAAIVLENEKKSLNKSAESENWNLRVVLSDNNGKRDSWNEIAVGRTAKTLGEPPAGMGDRVNLSIVEGKKRLAKSVKKNADDLEWDLEVSATTSRDGKLSFEGLESVWEKGMRVYATVDNETVEVVKDSPVDVKLSSNAKNVSVRVTKSAVVANVAKNLLKGLRVNQAPNVLNVGFDAASKLAGANVKVSVVGIDGRVVATNRAVAREGSNAISVKKPKQGVYFVKVKVGSLSAVTRVMVR